jgi:hypothetical protein
VHLALFVIGLLGPPTAVAIAIPNLIRSLVVSTLASWTSATLATHWFLQRNGDPVATLVWFFLFVLPCAATLPAALVATRLARPRAQLIPAIGMALLGVVVALCVMVALSYIHGAASPDDLAVAALVTAMPAVYAACGAAYATHLSSRRI